MTAILLTLTHLIISLAWIFNYSRVRKDRKYANEKKPVSKDSFFKYIGKTIFLIGLFVTIVSFWSDSKFLLKFHNNLTLQTLGIAITFFATLFYIYSLATLGKNYAPCFDSHKPHEIVKSGPYKLIRHPVYSANILNTIGIVIASGSWITMILGFYGCGKLVLTLLKEEKYLAREFSDYKSYMGKTWRLAPFVF